MFDNLFKNNRSQEYKYGFQTDVDTSVLKEGLSEETLYYISSRKQEPSWMLEFRLEAYRYWKTLSMPQWGNLHIPDIDFQSISYYAEPCPSSANDNQSAFDAQLIDTFDKLGVPLSAGQSTGVAVEAIMDSVSVKTTFSEVLKSKGILFCSISEAVKLYPELVRQYLGSVISYKDNFFAALNTAVFTEGSFVFIPRGVRCPMELSAYFRINSGETGQFSRTLIIAEDDSYLSYLEGCTAPVRTKCQLNAAVVEVVVMNRAEVKFSTIQNWYPGDKNGIGGIYNLVTKRGLCLGEHSRLSWTQVETGSAITSKYPSCLLMGDYSSAEFYSVAVTNNHQQADTGAKMLHYGKHTSSRVVSKGISSGESQNTYRGLIYVDPKADYSRNYSQCDSLLIGSSCGAHTFPCIENRNDSSTVEHEATTSKISEEQIFYCNQRGIPTETAVGLIVNGYVRDVIEKLPLEYAVEAQKLLELSLDSSVG